MKRRGRGKRHAERKRRKEEEENERAEDVTINQVSVAAGNLVKAAAAGATDVGSTCAADS